MERILSNVFIVEGEATMIKIVVTTAQIKMLTIVGGFNEMVPIEIVESGEQVVLVIKKIT